MVDILDHPKFKPDTMSVWSRDNPSSRVKEIYLEC